ncbi:hypothetical protein ABI59_13020 [Acidobacteria bacterium Mor1]|nr:hypothetical protein ABI59_13020 [Acidobacteria bacterium Mor1]
MLNRDPHSLWRLPAASGLLLVLAYYSSTLVANFVLFLPMLIWLEREPEAPRLRRMWAGFLFGFIGHGIALYFHYAMAEISWLAWVMYVSIVMAYGIRFALTFALLGWLRRRTGLSYVWLLPAAWIPFEWAGSWGDLRMTADHLGHSLAKFPWLVQFADLFGLYGVTAFLLMINGCVFQGLQGFYRSDRRRGWIGFALLWVAVLGYDAWSWQHHQARLEAAPTMRIGFVQPNIPIQVKRGDGHEQREWEALRTRTQEVVEQGAEFVIWPESSRPWPLYHHLEKPDTYRMAEVQALARTREVAMLVGVEYWRHDDDPANDELYNAAILVHEDGTLDETWGAKVYLVPFTEGLPFRRFLGPLLEGKSGGEWRWIVGGFTPGPATAIMEVGDARIGTLVCYEQLFQDLPRGLRNAGANLQVVITNDAWFGDTLFQPYLADVLRLRAIENRTSYVRVANTGISGFLDPLGRYRGRTPLFVETAGVDDVALMEARTLYNRVGELVAWIAIAGLMALMIRARRG